MNVATNKSLNLPSQSTHTDIKNFGASSLNPLRRQLLIIDPRVTDYKSFLSVIPPKTEIHILDPNLEGIAQISAILGNSNDIEALHIISHGADGTIHLGNNTLDSSNLDSYTTQLQQWQQALSPNADLLLYGCDIAATEIGKTFIAQLAHLTGVDVAASENITGKGGDGELETQFGNIETTPLSLANYEYTLASPVANTDTKALPVGATKTTIQVLSNDTDADGDKLTIQSVTTPTAGGTVAIEADIYAGGYFTDAGGDPNADYIAKWDGTKWSALGTGLKHAPWSIAINGSDIYATGLNFYGQSVDLDDPLAYGYFIPKWDGSSWSTLGGSFFNPVHTIAINGSDIYAGGGFLDAGGDPNADNIAKWNGTTWSPVGGGINDTAVIMAIAFNGSEIYAGGWNLPVHWNGTTWSSWGFGLYGVLNAIAVNGSDIYAGGDFFIPGWYPADDIDYIAKWDGISWSALGSSLNAQVNAIVINGSDIYAGGHFTDAGGDVNADYIAKWNGTSWSALGTGLNDTVSEIIIHGNDIYAGGGFTDAGGDVNADGIAKWDGTTWSALGSGINGGVESIALGPDYLTYTPPSLTFNGIDTFNYTITDGTTTASNSVTVVVNDAPVLNVSGTPTLTAINQDDSSNNGTLISDIIAALGGTKITDINASAFQGIAITGLNTSNGSWEYTTDGTTWNAFTASVTSARLLASDASTRIRFVPNSGYTGTLTNAITFAAWDQIIGTNGGTEDVTAGNTTYGTSSTFSSATETADITVNPFPTITGITSPETDGNYAVGSVIPIAITFSQIVNVTGTPQLSLNTGATATYSSGSGSDTLTFNYTVAAGQNTADLDYSTTTALALNNGTIQSVTNGDAILTLATPGEANSLGANKALIIDTIAPTVMIEQDAGQADPTAANTINYQVVFSEAVTEFDTSDIVLGGTANPTTAVVTGSGTTYNVAVSGMSANGTVTAAVKAGAATDAANNVSAASTSTDNTVTYDNTIPTISTINRANPNPSNANSVNYTVTFSETVTGVDEADFTLVPTGISGASITNITGSGSTYTVAVNAGTGDGTLQLNLVDDDSIKNGLNVPLGGPGASNGNSSGQLYQIDKTAPTATATVNDITTAGGTSTQFTVTYSDGTGIDPNSLGNSNLRVTSAGGFSQLATLINYTGSETTTTATYAIAPPGGSWDKADNGTYAIAVEAAEVKDPANNLIAATTLGSFTVDINRAPVVETAIAPGTATATQPFSFQFPADTFTDADGDTLTYSATLDNDSSLPSWLNFNSTTRTFSGTPMVNNLGSLNIKVTASDGTATVSEIFALSVSELPNTAPVVNEAIADVTTNVSAPFNFIIPQNTFSDAEGNPLTYSATLEDGSPLPSWLIFDTTTGSFSGTPTVNNIGSFNIQVTASDGSLSVSDIFALTVSDLPNTAPVLSNAIADVTANVSAPFNFILPGNTFSDADGNPLTYSATLENGSPLPSWLIFDTTTGSFSGTPMVNHLGSINIQITASDGSLSVSDIFALTVTDAPNTAPVVNEAIADASATVTEAFTLTIPNGTFTDADGNPLTYNATLEDGSPLPSWLSFDATTNTFTGTPSPNNRGNLSIKITASDGSLSVSDTFTLTVNEIATPPAEEPPAETPNAAPVLENAISSLNAIAFQPFSFTLPDDTFSDPDGDSLTYIATLENGSPLPEWLEFDSITGTFTGLPTQDAIGNLTIKLTASDGTASVDTELTINVLSKPDIMSGPWGPIGPPTFAAFLKQNPNSQAVALPDLTAICHGEMRYPGPNLTEITLDGSETDDNLIGGDRPETFNGFGGNDFLHGLSGNDNLFGSERNDLIHGNRGNDYIEGGNGNDEIHAGKDDDIILGGEGDDELYGNYGNDIIMAGNGNDFANGNQGDDILKGGNDNDILHGGKGDDTVMGENGTDILLGDLGNDIICVGSGNDFVSGNQGDDTLEGGDGDDVLWGGKDNDILIGDNGEDWLFGDLGYDVVMGGAGGDRFVLRDNAETDLILDFTNGEDLIGLAQGLTFNDLTLTQQNHSAWIYAGNELLAILNGVNASTLNQQDFFTVV